MRALIEHQGHYGFFGFRPEFLLHLDLRFSNEERAIIRTRALQEYVFNLSPGILAGSESGHSRKVLTALAAGGFAFFVGGILVVFLTAVAPVLEPLDIIAKRVDGYQHLYSNDRPHGTLAGMTRQSPLNPPTKKTPPSHMP